MNQQAIAAVRACRHPGLSTVHHVHCVSPVAENASRLPTTVMRLEEDGEFYVPDFLFDDDFDIGPALFDAAEEHARDLHEAERCIDEALNLADVLRAAMGDAGDSRAMQVDTVMAIVREKLSRAHARIDEYETCHLNLFIAYVELRKQAAGG
ncbi:MAG: hypothetical protein WD448_03415 [Woeseia sp.]